MLTVARRIAFLWAFNNSKSSKQILIHSRAETNSAPRSAIRPTKSMQFSCTFSCLQDKKKKIYLFSNHVIYLIDTTDQTTHMQTSSLRLQVFAKKQKQITLFLFFFWCNIIHPHGRLIFTPHTSPIWGRYVCVCVCVINILLMQAWKKTKKLNYISNISLKHWIIL